MYLYIYIATLRNNSNEIFFGLLYRIAPRCPRTRGDIIDVIVCNYSAMFFLSNPQKHKNALFTATMANHCLILFWGSPHVLKCQWITGSLVLLRCWEGHWFGQGSLISLAAIAWRGHPNRSHRRKTEKKQHLQFPISTTWISCEYHHIWWWRLPMFYIVLWCLVVFDDGDQQGLERSRAFIICKRCYPSWQFLAKGKLGQLKRDKSPNPKIQSARAKTSSLLGVCPYYYVLITWNCGKLLHYYYNWG
jgi:hypothetical protein